jgi:hypothetical protein
MTLGFLLHPTPPPQNKKLGKPKGSLKSGLYFPLFIIPWVISWGGVNLFSLFVVLG